MPKAPTGSDSRWVSESYLDQREFLLNLDQDEERAMLLKELTEIYPKAWQITQAFFCLDGRAHRPIQEVGKDFGLSGGGAQEAIGMLLYYIDSPFEVSKASMRKSQNLEKKIRRKQERNQQLAEHDLRDSDLPDKLPKVLYPSFALVSRVWRYDGLSEYFVTRREQELLIKRYGLLSGKYQTLESIGIEWGVTRERIRQIEREALHRLEILSRKIPEWSS